jgi:hypothetical protein
MLKHELIEVLYLHLICEPKSSFFIAIFSFSNCGIIKVLNKIKLWVCVCVCFPNVVSNVLYYCGHLKVVISRF